MDLSMNNLSQEHLVIIRTSGSVLNINSYNCQELGLAKALVRKGLKVSLIMAGKKREELSFETDSGLVKVYLLPYKALNQSLAWFIGIDELLAILNPTCIQVHEFGMLMSWRIAKWAKKHGVRCFLIQGNYRTTQKPVFKQLESMFNSVFGRSVLKQVDGIGCKTKMAERYVHKYCKRGVALTYIGLDTDVLKGRHADMPKELAERIAGKKVLLYVGTLESRRNPLFLLEVVVALPDDYILLVVGDGPLRANMEATVKEKHLEQKCLLLGKKSQGELPAIYNQADLFLLASDYEIYGMVILEAMYYGIPVISTLTAGTETLIEPTRNGLILDNTNVKEWSTAIVSVCEEPRLLGKMKTEAKRKIENELIWDKACESFLKLYSIKNII